MQPDASRTFVHYRSPFLAAFGVVVLAVMFVAWFNTGEIYRLLSALAFAAMAPTWYVLPVSFTDSFSSEWKQRRSGSFPNWAQWLTLIGLILLCASLGLRWFA